MEHPSHNAPKCVNCGFYTRNLEALDKYKKSSAIMSAWGIVLHLPPSDCQHPSLPKNLVTGLAINMTADAMRLENANCGFDGKLFEQALELKPEPIPAFIMCEPPKTHFQLFKSWLKVN